MKRYPAYKASETKWIPAIPSHWVVKRLKHISPGISVGLVINPSTYHDENGTVPMITGRNVTHRGIDISNVNNIAHQNNEMLESTRIYAGDLVSIRVGYPGLTSVVPSELDGINCASLIIIRKSNTMNSYYLSFLMNSPIGMKQVDVVAYGSAQKQFNVGHAIEFVFPVPPLDEQRAIARFLDDKTAQLDQLITQKQQMLELLREERAALINHVVTKGLDAAAPLRDSGVEWLGEVPAHWEVKKLKWIAEIQGGIALSAGKKLENPVMLPYLRVANVQDGYLDLSEVKTVEVEAEQIARYTLHKGDLLMNEGGDNDKLGRGCVWQGEIEPCLHQNHVFAVRLFNGYNPEWLNLITATEGARTHFLTRAKQSTNLASISSSNIKELPVLLPPVAEQQQIMALVAEETARVAEVTDTINQEIALLQEYRAALIAEAVTGQLDVRDYAPVSAVVLM